MIIESMPNLFRDVCLDSIQRLRLLPAEKETQINAVAAEWRAPAGVAELKTMAKVLKGSDAKAVRKGKLLPENAALNLSGHDLFDAMAAQDFLCGTSGTWLRPRESLEPGRQVHFDRIADRTAASAALKLVPVGHLPGNMQAKSFLFSHSSTFTTKDFFLLVMTSGHFNHSEADKQLLLVHYRSLPSSDKDAFKVRQVGFPLYAAL